MTNLPDIVYPKQTLFNLYHERQGIDRSILQVRQVRATHQEPEDKESNRDKGLMLLSCITHNLIVHALASMKRVIKRGFIGVKAFVGKLACSKALLTRIEGDIMMLTFTSENPTVRQYIKCVKEPTLLDYITQANLHQI